MTPAAGDDNRLLEVRDLQKLFPIRRGFLRRVVGQVRAVDGVSFHVERGETLALVGESGCGKTTTSRCVLRAITPTAGQILFRTAEGPVLDVATLPRRGLRPPVRSFSVPPTGRSWTSPPCPGGGSGRCAGRCR